MKYKTLSFNKAYDEFYHFLNTLALKGNHLLEIGGGAHPSLLDRENISYTIIDPDENELEKAPNDIQKINLALKDLDSNRQYDLVLTKMVLEHVENPDAFHAKIFHLLKPEGRVIHFFACRHSLPGLMNRILPEWLGEKILSILKNRETGNHPKYPAFYKRTKGGVSSQIQYFQQLGYEIDAYRSYVGHKYFKSIPIFKQIEQLYSWILVRLKMKSLATVALVILKKSK